MLTEGPRLAHYTKDKDNMVTTDASKTGLGITLWQKEDDGNIKPIAYGSRYLNDTEKNYSIGESELLAVVWGLEKFRFHLYGKKVYLYTDHQALEPLMKRNRCNKQYSARLTRWLDRLAHFDIAIQHIAGSNLKFTDYFSRNPVEGATPEDNYDEEYVINILSEQAKLNAKYGQLFADQSDTRKRVTEIENGRSENKTEQQNNQSEASRIFENKNGKLKIVQNRKVSVSETEDEDDDDDEEMPEEIGSRTYDTSERNGRYQPIQTNPEEDTIQIHTDGDEIPQGENTDNKKRRSSRNINKPNRYGSVPYTGNFWG